jgi:hypothetical protein
MNQGLKELSTKRKQWVDATRENNFEDGIKRLLTELYPDNAHFIYELLQNAEDNGATEVRFKLDTDCITFEHNGKRLFTLSDVDSITSIGVSTKRDDYTSIGKFGVGFKAVFAYTNAPEIHSGDYHFRIQDLVVPEPIPGNNQQPQSDFNTSFIFPFDHHVKSPDQALSEIKRGLIELDANTLLFLDNIHTIVYNLPGKPPGSLKRVNKSSEHIQIKANHPDEKKTVTDWLRLQKDVIVDDNETNTKKNCRVAIAYGLSKDIDEKSRKAIWNIKDLEHGDVSIFFPAEKETSNLRFHVHAPFASTVARDSVRDCDANDQLRDHLADLVVESLSIIRDRDMLNVSFLEVLPNSLDNLPDFYEPIRDAIVDAFNNEPLTPTKSKKHAPAKKLFSGPAVISEVINDNDLSLLTSLKTPLWVANPPQRNQREDRFLGSLEIKGWSWKELASAFDFGYLGYSTKEHVPDISTIESWISKKPDAWLMRFYALLGEARLNHNAYFNLSRLKIIRVENKAGNLHVSPANAYFQPDGNPITNNGINIVKLSVYNAGRSDSQKRFARSFLEAVGIKPFDERAVMRLRLQKFKQGSDKISETYFKEFKQFIKYWKANKNDSDIFKHANFLVGETSDGATTMLPPSKICLDSPYLTTGLANFTDVHNKYALWDGYQKHLNPLEAKDLVDFLKEIGVLHQLQVTRCDIEGNINLSYLTFDCGWGTRRTTKEIDEDYNIDNIKKYLGANSTDVSRLIWFALINANERCAKARYRPNGNCLTRETDSQIIHHLKNSTWIPDKSGTLHKPQDIIESNLPPDFPFDNTNRLLTAIGFGENARRQNAEFQARNQQAQSLGFASYDAVQKIVDFMNALDEKGITIDQVMAKYTRSAQENKPIFPTKKSYDPDRRRTKVLGDLKESQNKQYNQAENSVRTSRSTIEPDQYLRSMYTNEDRQMVCQICQEEMPFKKRDGNHYFEAVEALSNHYFNKEYEAQFLALCPTCAARYKEFIKRDEDQMAILKNQITESDETTIPLQLGALSASVRFVETHLIDLKVTLGDDYIDS